MLILDAAPSKVMPITNILILCNMSIAIFTTFALCSPDIEDIKKYPIGNSHLKFMAVIKITKACVAKGRLSSETFVPVSTLPLNLFWVPSQTNPFLIAISSILKLTNILCSVFFAKASKVSKLSVVKPGSASTVRYQRDNVTGMFSLRLATRHASRVLPALRPMSSAPEPLVAVEDHDGIAVVTLQRPPVNSLNLELLQALHKALNEVENNKPRGMILTSASPTVFSAGLDITEMFKPEKNRAELFWSTLQDTWLKLFGFKYATAAAINGHSPAGGCLLAMSCEWRAMVGGKYTIGLNESALGIVATPWFMDTMCHTIRRRDAEIALTTAKLFKADEALKVGLIDEIATDKADAIEKCKIFIQKFDKIPPLARTVSKLRIRQEPLRKLQENRKKDMDDFLQSLNEPKVQKGLELYIQSLKKKQK